MSARVVRHASFAEGIAEFFCGMYMHQTVGLIAPDRISLPDDFRTSVIAHFSYRSCSFSTATDGGLNPVFAKNLCTSPEGRRRTEIFLVDSGGPTFGCDFVCYAPDYLSRPERRANRTEDLVRSCAFLVIFSSLPLRGDCAFALRIAKSIFVNTLIVIQ